MTGLVELALKGDGRLGSLVDRVARLVQLALKRRDRLRPLVARLPLCRDIAVERDAARPLGLERPLELLDLMPSRLLRARGPSRLRSRPPAAARRVPPRARDAIRRQPGGRLAPRPSRR